MERPPIPTLLVVLLAGAVVVTVLIVGSTSTVGFGAYNSEWDGGTTLRDQATTQSNLTVALDTEPYETATPTNTIAIVLAPDRPYTQSEVTRLQNFVANGGTLLVADNFGATADTPPTGNTVLAAVGADARFNGALLRDEQSYYQSPALPVATNVSTHPYTTDVEQLTLNYGTVVAPNGATPLVVTSPVAYLDENRSGSLDGNETVGSYPVVTVESVGAGRVVTTSDPSVFINAMLSREGNAAFTTALFTAHDQVILDYTTRAGQPPLAVGLIVLQETPLLQAILGIGSVLGAWVGVTVLLADHNRSRLARWLPERLRRWLGLTPSDPAATATLTEADLVAYLRQEHPDWDDDRIHRVVAGVIPEEQKQQTDE